MSRLIGLLLAIANLSQIPVTQPWCQFITNDSYDCSYPNVKFAPIVISHPGNSPGDHFGLIDHREWMHLIGHMALSPFIERSIDRRELHHCDLHVALLVEQFTT